MDKKYQDEILKEVYDIVTASITDGSEDDGYDNLQKNLNEIVPVGDVKCEVSNEDKYTISVKLTLPPFVPSINKDTGELWYVCTRHNVNLMYTIRDDQYVFASDDGDLLDLICDGEIKGKKIIKGL